jgi:hypothetical protein
MSGAPSVGTGLVDTVDSPFSSPVPVASTAAAVLRKRRRADTDGAAALASEYADQVAYSHADPQPRATRQRSWRQCPIARQVTVRRPPLRPTLSQSGSLTRTPSTTGSDSASKSISGTQTPSASMTPEVPGCMRVDYFIYCAWTPQQAAGAALA